LVTGGPGDWVRWFERVRRRVNPILRKLLGLELTRICLENGETIGVGIRKWLQ